MFESEFAKSEYIEKDNAVLHVWKKEAHFDDYRDPVKASLEILREHKNSIFIVDARNGFEDGSFPSLKRRAARYGDLFFLRSLTSKARSIFGRGKLRRISELSVPYLMMRLSLQLRQIC